MVREIIVKETIHQGTYFAGLNLLPFVQEIIRKRLFTEQPFFAG
jgi:hypothetical protein